MEQMTNPRTQEGFDLDMLTNEEKRDLGMDPSKFKYQPCGHGEKGFSQSETKEPKCHFCNRKMKSPVAKFEKFGIDFIPDGELAHYGCAKRQFNQVKEVLTKELGKEKE